MRLSKVVLAALLVLIFAAQVLGIEFQQRKIAIKPDKASIAIGYDPKHIEVKFIDKLDIGLSTDGVPIDRSNQTLKSNKAQTTLSATVENGGSWRKMSSVDENMIDLMVRNAEQTLNREIADLNNYFVLTVPDGVNPLEWIDQFNSLEEIEIAQALPLPMPAPVIPPDFTAAQIYLNPSTDGLDFNYAWTIPGGTGFGFSSQAMIIDFEYSWNLNHNDLAYITYMYNPALTPVDPFSDNNHGTAVAGEVISLANGFGTTGMCHGGIMWAAPTNFTTGWDIGAAMLYVMNFGQPGFTFLIEQQMAGPNYTGSGQVGLIPIEWWQSWYNVILTAIGNGINVVEAAGNGSQNLDDPVYSTGNGGHWPFLPANNSGAIIVGAGAAPASAGGSDVDRSRLWFSNYGSRVDVQGWGERVVTTGYGSYYSAEGVNYWYTSTFSGTSSASPMIASACGVLNHIYKAATGNNLTPSFLRNLLMTTGAPQQSGTYPLTQNIGPRPDLMTAIAALPLSCCNMRGDVNDDGSYGISDLTYLVDYMFNTGPAPPCQDEGDVNKDGSIGISDITYFVAYLFQGGSPPPSC